MTFKQLIKDCHLSQGEVAGLMGVNRRSLERWVGNDNAPELVIKALHGYKAKIEQLRTVTTGKAKKQPRN